MVDFVEYVVSELKSKRLAKAGALELMQQFLGRPTDSVRLHPLVHRNVSTLTQQRYRSHLSGAEFFLRDHRVRMGDGFAASVLPGVAYLEMARAAIADAVPELAATSLIAFEDVLWLMPLVVQDGRDVFIDIDADEDCLAFRVFSEDAAGNGTDHASGRARFYDAVETAALDLAGIRERMQREHWDSASIYDTYAQVGIEYGPAHRGIVQLDSGEAQVLADLSLPDALAGEDNAAYRLHPSLIDSALQAAIGLGDRGVLPTDPMLPFALESLCILGDCPQTLHAFVRRVDAAGDDNHQLVLDLDLCDPDGNICVQMRGFRARRFDAKSAAAGLSDAATIETLVAVPEWGAYRPREAGAAAADFVRSHVLLCDLPGIDPAALALSLPTCTVEAIASSSVDDPASRYRAIALQVFERLQSILKQPAGASVLVQCVIGDTPEALLSSGLGAMLKTAALENPALSAQLVIVEAAVSLQQLAGQLTHASAQSHLSPIQCRAEEWRPLDWKTLPHFADGGVEHPYKEDGVYVITGGLGGLGSVFAQDILAHAQHAQVVVTGRSPLDDAIRQRLDASAYASRLHYRALDLNDSARCVSTIEDIQNGIGKIRGILHCAGARNDSVILKKTTQEMAEVLAPKVQGTWHLDAATRHLDLDFFALFSSGVSVFGNVGQADYAAANGFMDAFARYRTQLASQQSRSGRTIAIDWPLWQDGGMRPDAETLQWLQARTGMTPMRTASGIAVLCRALVSGYAQVLAVEGDVRKLRRLFDAPPARVVAKPAPAVQATAQTTAQPVEQPAGMPATGDLRTRARDFLRREFAPVLKIAAAQIDIHEALENYGINSILAMNLTSQLEKHFGPLPKTLFFEYQTIDALSEHLVQAHAATLQSMLNPAGAPAAAPAAAPASRAIVPTRDTARSEAKSVLRGKAAAPAFMARRSPSATPEAIAVIGLSGRYPEAETLQDYWRNLRDGKDCIVEIPAERWRWESYYTDDREQRGHYSKWGGFIVGADEFDPQFFNVSPREAPYIDPQERMFLQHAWMAIEDAGYSRKSLRIPHGNSLPGQVGVYAGVMYGEYNRSGSLASIANRVSYVLNLHGPSMTLDTMCSSSLTAIHLACQDLRHGRTDMAVAGGVNLSIHPDKYSMLSAGQFISTSGHCQSFGEGGDGYIPGEGVGVAILKRLSDAERDGDAIYAIIRGSALNHGGKTNGYTVPNPQAQAAVIADALMESGVDARHVSYIEAHGTGTKLGDPIEIVALSKAFQQNTSDTQFCMLGSAKSNIGHCESAAGIAGLTKVILQMQHRQIVPSLHSERLNPNIDFARTPFTVNQRLHDWDAPVVDGKRIPRIAGLSSFGAGGSNAHFVIQEYIAAESTAGVFAGLPAIVPLSARTPEQLTRKAQDLLTFLEEASGAGRSIDHAALAYTLQIGRDAMDERLGFVVDSTQQLQDALRAWLGGDTSSGFRGQVKANKDMLSLFAADPEYDEAVDKWIAQRKLAKLVDLWVKGFDLDWQKFHGAAKQRRMHLPTYPFAKEKYWIDPMVGLFPLDARLSAAPALATARSAIHPLLHDNTSDLGQLRFSSVFSGREPFLGKSPAVAGLPSAALLEMACAALAQAQRSHATATTVELRALRFGAPFAADGASALHIALYPSANDAIDFDIYSGDDERVHAQGSGRVLPSAPAAKLDVDALAMRLQPAPSPTGHPHAAWRLWRGEQELLIAVDAEGGASPSGDFLLQPALVQAVLDTAATALGVGVSTPGSIETLDIVSACTPSMRVWVRWHDAHAAAWDMDWCDADGNLCLRWRGVVPVAAVRTDAPSALSFAQPSAQLQAADAFVETMPAASLAKPTAVALADLSAPPLAGIALPKPTASRLVALDRAISAPIAIPHSPVSIPAPMPVAAAPLQAAQPQAAGRPRRREEVLAFLKSTLSQALYLDEASIDNDRSFVDLGLDSIVGVEWVKSINKGLGINIAATRVYDYANIDALGAYVESQLPAQEAAAADTSPVAPVGIAPVAAAPATPQPAVAPAAQASVPSIEALQPELRRSLAQALYLDENAIDNDKSFVDLGLDSIVGVEWVKAINKAYGLEISATRVYDYATIRALAGFVHGELAKLPPEQRVSRATAPAPEPAQQVVPQATQQTVPAAVAPAVRMPSASMPVLQRRARALPAHAETQANGQANAEGIGRRDDKIAIVGMSGRYPDADNLSQFWRNLVESRNSIKVIPPDRWDVDAYYDPTPGKPGKVYCKWLGLLDGAENFDPMFFQISPSEAEVMDPQHRLFMQESYRAFQDASYSGAALSNQKCGVYLGIMSSEYSFLLSKGNPLNVETTGNSFAIGAARIAYHLNLKGPAIPIDTACSSSLVAIHLASQALLNHEIDMGLAGGVSLYLIPESYVGMCRAGMLSRDGQCKTFDNSADGFVPGEGVGTVVLKRLSDAERDGDNIYGVIIGSGINQDGKTNGITAPSVNSQIELEREIYRRYGIDAASISYVETHGTGTKLGDPIELEALSTVFKEHTDRKHFCALGAVKSNIGHVSGAAGVAGVHKVLLSLRHRKLVPNVNLVKHNTLFDFANSPFYINDTVQDWTAAPGQKRRAAVSAFGFSGTNAHIVIEEYVPAARRDAVARQPYIVPLSARTAAQLRSQAEDLLAFLAQTDAGRTGNDIDLRSLACTLQIGRDAMRERCAWVVDSVVELQTQLHAFLAGETNNVAWHRGSVARTQDSTVLTDEAAMLQRRSGTQQTAGLAALWAEGATIQWRTLYPDALPPRMHLPTYPFAKERYWPQPAAAVVAQPSVAQPASPQPSAVVRALASPPARITAAMPSAAIVEAKQSTFYAPTWQAASLPSQRTPFGRDDVLLILDTDDRLYEQIKARLHVATPLKAIILVQLADAYRQHAGDRFSVDATHPEHFETLVAALRAQSQAPTHVIHNLNAARLLPDDLDSEALERALQLGIDGMFGLCKALASGGAQQSPCAFVSFFHAEDAANTAPCSALAAFYRSLALENNRYRGRVLALDHAGVDASVSVIDTVTCVVDELQSPLSHETEVRYRMSGAGSAQRFVRVLTQQHPEKRAMTELPLKHRGVYLITGGLGGLGYLFAHHLAERYRAKLVLTGRSSPNAESERKLEQLRALGADVSYVSADIADADQVRDLIASAKAQFGSLNGVLHSAGVNRDSLLVRKDRDTLRQVLAPKVQGTLHLDRATADEPLDLFVLFSSGAGSFGNPGQTDYSYANAFMDAFSEHRESMRARRERFGKTLSIAWPFWLDGGMQVSAADLQRTEERSGLCALPTDVGIAYWETLLRSDSTRALALYGYASKIAAYCDPSAAPAAEANPQSAAIDRESLRALTQQYLCGLVHNETRLPVDLIDINERFEAFGFDSIMIGRFNAALEHDLGDLPKTLMYEYETVADLAGYLCESAQDALVRRLSPAGATTDAATDAATDDPVQAIADMPAAMDMMPTHAEPIAIIGVHADFPQSRDLHTFWEHLKAGDDLIQLVPGNRWNYADFYDPDPEQAANGKIYCKWGGFLEDFDKFDASFFNIPNAEADILDPQERCFLQSAWAAVEDAGYTRERLKRMYPKGKSTDVGVFVGVTTNSYNLLAPEAWQRGQMVTPSAMPWSIANRVSYYFDFQGPSMPVDTACSSSLVAVHLACESLRRRECQLALAGGVNLYLHPAKYQSFCQRRMLAVGDRNRSYGAGDDGFVPGEGVGTLVLKPLRLAEQDGDPICGVILGSAFDHSGRSNGYATPNPNAQAQVIGDALAQANVPARSIGFIEGHGTGTQMGDSLEIAAISQAFGQQTADRAFCALGSVKANIGHAESATSIAGIAKILLQFKHRQIAPSIHADTVNPDIDFERSPCRLQTQLIPWETSGGIPRRALINAFGAGGVNACAVLEEYVPVETRVSPVANGSSLFVLSAMNADRLREYALRYVAFLERNPDVDIAGLCHTTQIGREPMPERLALLVDSAAQLREGLQRWLAADPRTPEPSAPLWHGSLDARRASLPATREQREQMQALCAARDMAALAQLWVQGGKVEWQRAHPGPLPVGASLPTYPFARERHWIVGIEAPEAMARPSTATAPSRLHPLLSHNSSTLKQVSFDAVLADDQYYAREHRIQGQPVFPGAGFIEMACVAATIAGQRRVRQLKDIFWVQPLALGHASQSLQISLRNSVGDSTEFAAKTSDDDHESILHCEGRVVFHDGAAHKPSTQTSMAEWRQRCREPRAGSDYYQRFKRLGFDYGAAFQIIDEVSVGDGCAIASLRLANAQTADFEQYILHPCLIDGALQTVVALLAADEGGVPHLPFAIDEIEMLGSLTPHCYALVERSGNNHDAHASVLQFNILIVSESGEPLVKITNFYVRALVMAETPAIAQSRSDARMPLAVNP